jgi:hypothetical protein
LIQIFSLLNIISVRNLDFVVFPVKNHTHDLHIFEPVTKFRKKCPENILKIDSNHRENTIKPEQNCRNLKFFQKTRGCGYCIVYWTPIRAWSVVITMRNTDQLSRKWRQQRPKSAMFLASLLFAEQVLQ